MNTETTTANVTTTESLQAHDTILGASVGSRFGHDNYHDSRLVTATQVTNKDVYNGAGDKLGWLDEVVIDKQTGKVEYVVLAFGGFLGINEKYHPLPWERLNYDEAKGHYNIDASNEEIGTMHQYDRAGIDQYRTTDRSAV
jgi:sporulation protein YlmC with PRC-barrel domain